MTPTRSEETRTSRTAGAVAALLVGVLLVLTGSASPASAGYLDDKRRAAERAKANAAREADALEGALEGIEASLAQAVLDLHAIEVKLPIAQAKLAEAEAAVVKAQREAAIIAARLQDAKDQEVVISAKIAADAEREKQIRTTIGQMARAAYKGGNAVTSMDVVLGAGTTEDFVDQYGLVETALRTQTRALSELREIEATNRNSQVRLAAVRERVTELKAEADQKVVEADKAKAAAEAAKAEIEDLIKQQKAKQATIEAQKAAVQEQQRQLEFQQRELAREIAAIIRRQKAAAQAAGVNTKPSGPVGRSLFGNPTSVSPIHVTSEYGMRYHPILHYTRLHAGIDLRTYCGTKVRAGRSGTVEWARYRYGFGNQVMIDHGYVNGNSLMSSYNHLTRFVVRAGQKVNKGQLIGYSGNTGTSGGCHLHFEVYVNGATTNPRPLLPL